MVEQSLPQRDKATGPVCCLCRFPVDLSDDTLVRGELNNGLYVYAHALCVEGTRVILGVQSNTVPTTEAFAGLVRQFKGDWILNRRQFANQYVPILAYFYLNRNEPKSAVDLTQWLARNGVEFSNPAVPIKRLADRSSLSLIVSEDGIKRYLLTNTGEDELMKHLDDLNPKDGE